MGELSTSTKQLLTDLSGVIGSISDNSMNLNASSEEMSMVASQAREAMDSINENLASILMVRHFRRRMHSMFHRVSRI